MPLEKALRRNSKVVNYLNHARPVDADDTEEAGRWARAIDAAKTVQRYLERQNTIKAKGGS